MKVFKFLFLMFMAVSTIGFTACDKDEDENKTVTTVNGVSILGTWVEDDGDLITTFTFHENGTFVLDDNYSDDEPAKGTYSINGNKLTLVYMDGDKEVINIIEISASRITTDDDGEEVVWTKR